MRVGIDLDGCGYDVHRVFMDHLIEQDEAHEVLPYPYLWNVWECWAKWGWTKEKWWGAFGEAISEGVVFRVGDPVEGFPEALRRLRLDGHTVHIVTHRDVAPGAIENTVWWLRQHAVEYDTLTFAADKTTVACDVFIDDSLDNYEALNAAGVHAILMSQPWNTTTNTPCRRVSSWAGFLEAVEMRRSVMEREAADHTDEIFTPVGIDGGFFTPFDELPVLDLGGSPTWGHATEVRVVNEQTGGEKGSKLARYDLIPAAPLHLLAEHFGRGALKYEDRNWEQGVAWSLCFAALNRHLWAFWGGENVDPELGSPHLVAVAWHAFALLEFDRTRPELDDRPAT